MRSYNIRKLSLFKTPSKAQKCLRNLFLTRVCRKTTRCAKYFKPRAAPPAGAPSNRPAPIMTTLAPSPGNAPPRFTGQTIDSGKLSKTVHVIWKRRGEIYTTKQQKKKEKNVTPSPHLDRDDGHDLQGQRHLVRLAEILVVNVAQRLRFREAKSADPPRPQGHLSVFHCRRNVVAKRKTRINLSSAAGRPSVGKASSAASRHSSNSGQSWHCYGRRGRAIIYARGERLNARGAKIFSPPSNSNQ